MKTISELQADIILAEWARAQGVSLRDVGIIDDRRQRTIRQREIGFTPFFEQRRRARNKV